MTGERVALPGYALCAWLVLLPVADALALMLPLVPGDVAWRYAMASIMSRALMTPLLGVFCATVVASVFGHQRIHRVIAGVSVLGSLGLVLILALFLVASPTIAAEAAGGQLPAFGVRWALAVMKLVFGIAFLGLAASANRSLGQSSGEQAGIVWRAADASS